MLVKVSRMMWRFVTVIPFFTAMQPPPTSYVAAQGSLVLVGKLQVDDLPFFLSQTLILFFLGVFSGVVWKFACNYFERRFVSHCLLYCLLLSDKMFRTWFSIVHNIALKKKGNIPRRKASNTSLPNLPANFFTACSSLCFYTVIMSNCHTKYEWKNGTIICITASVGFLHVVCCKCVSARAQELVAQSCNLHLVGNAQL